MSEQSKLVQLLQEMSRTKLEFLMASNALINHLHSHGVNLPEGTIETMQRKAVEVAEAPGLVLLPDERAVFWKNEFVDLTVTEWLLLELLCRHPRMVKQRTEIQDVLDPTGESEVYYRTIDSHIKRIRKKFKAIDPMFAYIHTVYGGGYCLIRG